MQTLDFLIILNRAIENIMNTKPVNLILTICIINPIMVGVGELTNVIFYRNY